MKLRLVLISCLLSALRLVLVPDALASTTWYVNGANGNDRNNCTSAATACKTIGHAISLASSGDTIRVAAATYEENPAIGESLNLLGSGASTTVIDGGGAGTVVTISNATAHVSLFNFTIRNGSADTGGGVLNQGILIISMSTISFNRAHSTCPDCGAAGGGIENWGNLTLNNCSVTGNTVGPAIFGAGFGGGIDNKGTVTVNNSTLSGNFAVGRGGGIDNEGNLTINTSTLSGNTVQGSGGGGIENTGKLSISSSTISGNSAARFGGGINNASGSVSLQNSIVANSPSGGNCSGTITSKGYNLSSDGTCSLNGPGDMKNIDPLLGPLQNNGGPTQTTALLPGSPALDAGNPNGCRGSNGNLLKTDQRGASRPDKEDTGGCDIGAYERQSD